MSDIKKSIDSSAGFKRRLAITFVLLNMLVYSIAGLSLYQSRIKYELQAEVSTQNLSSVLEHYINGELSSIDMALIAVKHEAEEQIKRGGINKEALNRYMTRQHSYLSSLQGLRMTDSRGDVLYGTGGITPENTVNMSDRDYFVFERDNPKGDVFISKPVFGRIAKQWVINIARRVDNPDGSYAGTVYGALTLDHYIKIFSAINVGKMGAVTLRNGEMAVIVRYPEPKGVGSTIGNKTVSKEFSDQVKAGRKSATFRVRARIDGTERMFTYRKIADYPLFIIIGLAKDEYLAGWRKEAMSQLGLVVFFNLVTFITMRMLLTKWKLRKKVAVELLESRKQLADIISFLPDATLCIDKDKRVIIWNLAIEEMTGVSAQEMIGKDDYAYSIPFYGESRPQLIDLVFMGHEEIASQYPNITRKDDTLMGEVFCKSLYNNKGAWVFAKASPLYDQSGNIIGAIESIRDITESKQALEQVESLSQRLQLAVSSANLGVWDRTINDNKMVWNDRMFELYGITRETFTGNVDAWLNGLHPEDREAAVAASQAALNGEKKYDTVFRVCHPDGTVKHIKAEGLVIRGTDGTAERVIGVNADITEMKRAEEERTKLEGQLLQQNRLAAMGEMVSNIAHQWRQPLNNIALMVQNLQISFASGKLTTSEFDLEIDAVMQIILHMSSTINDFRNFFRQDKEKCSFLIAKVAPQAVGLLSAALKDGNIELDLQLEENIIVFGFMNEYMQALLNIIANCHSL